MNEVWMLDYLNAVFPRWGVFSSKEAAMGWVQTHDPERKNFYTPFLLTMNGDLEHTVPTTSPQGRYYVQR